MAKPLKMTELAQAVSDAETVTAFAFAFRDRPAAPVVTPQDHARLERQKIAFQIVLAEMLDNEYMRDMRDIP
jgi:hypothetical protein